jgi:N-dimethylarginine dimethylaminohydrolase
MSSTTHVLMCRPEHYRIAYEINPWMRRTNAVVEAAARAQWESLYRILLDLGVQVELVEQRPDVPDMVFTANAGIVAGSRFIPSNFRHPERQPEERLFTEWFASQSFEVAPVDSGQPWEGEGDVLPAGDRVFAASGPRTVPEALDGVDALLGVESVRLELADPRFYHLDTCLFPVDERLALFVPGAFSAASRERLAASFEDLVEVPMAEAERFACNALRVGDTVVLNAGCDETVEVLRRRGYRCISTPTGEFLKAGGSVKCLVLTLDRFAGPVQQR